MKFKGLNYILSTSRLLRTCEGCWNLQMSSSTYLLWFWNRIPMPFIIGMPFIITNPCAGLCHNVLPVAQQSLLKSPSRLLPGCTWLHLWRSLNTHIFDQKQLPVCGHIFQFGQKSLLQEVWSWMGPMKWVVGLAEPGHSLRNWYQGAPKEAVWCYKEYWMMMWHQNCWELLVYTVQ